MKKRIQEDEKDKIKVGIWQETVKINIGSRVLKEWNNHPYYQSNRNRNSYYARKRDLISTSL